MPNNIVIIGASGGIGHAFIQLLSKDSTNTLYTFSRSYKKTPTTHENIISANIDYNNEASIVEAAKSTEVAGPIDLVIVATGFLHDDTIMPERSLRELSAEKFEKNFLVNTIGPALVAKHFLPKMNKKQRAVFAILSARVGSINDNRLGGWYAYRASKAAVNMLIKTASIEITRKQPNTIVVGLHPGTVDSQLSEPFQRNIKSEKLFTPEYSTKKMMSVIQELKINDSGNTFAWDGKKIES